MFSDNHVAMLIIWQNSIYEWVTFYPLIFRIALFLKNEIKILCKRVILQFASVVTTDLFFFLAKNIYCRLILDIFLL